jgi:hypothetical protein
MGSSRKTKSTSAKSVRPVERTHPQVARKATKASTGKRREIPPGVANEIENQRGSLVTVVTLLHCLHVILLRQEDRADQDLDPSIRAALGWSSLPDVTAMLLQRTHAVLDALDSLNFMKTSRH